MKKRTLSLLVLLAMMLTLLAGCSGGNSTASSGSANNGSSNAGKAASSAGATGKKLKVSLLVTGSFGDKAFNDSAQAGMQKIKESLGDKCDVKMTEMGSDKTKFESSLQDASESDADVIITGTWDMKEIMEKVAPQYPDKKYIIFDTDVDYKSADLSNVYSMSYKQNEAAFLAGVLAANVTTSNMKYANKNAVIGFVGAKDTAAVINDSVVGYIEGAQFVNPKTKVLVSYVGSYTDSAKAKELALTQYSSGADCVFVAAGPASVGVIEAGTESQKYVIGVDSDQALAYKGQKEANYIISSAIKGVGTTIYNSVQKSLDGKLPYGKYEQLGLKEDAVGLADNDIYKSTVPESIRTKVDDAKKQLLDGKVKLDTAYGMDKNKLKQIISSAQ